MGIRLCNRSFKLSEFLEILLRSDKSDKLGTKGRQGRFVIVLLKSGRSTCTKYHIQSIKYTVQSIMYKVQSIKYNVQSINLDKVEYVLFDMVFH